MILVYNYIFQSGEFMSKLKTFQKDYRKLIVNRPWMMLLISVIFTVMCGMGLKGLSQNPDNRIFFS